MSGKTEIPAELRVLGRVYRVYTGRCDDDLRPSWGRVSHADLTIDIRGDLAPANQAEALFHELWHCLDHILRGAESLDEPDVHVLANGLYAALKQNRGLAEWILDGA